MIIPSGMISQLQPLDGSVNEPFKHCDAWLNKDNHISTPSSKLKRALGSRIVEWLSKAWEEVPVNIIPKSFLECWLSNVEDGTQDNILWDYSEQSRKGASSSENEGATEESLDKLSD
jgi:hypothetical protein